MDERIRVELVDTRVLPLRLTCVFLSAERRVPDALAAAGWKLDAADIAMGIFGRRCGMEDGLRDGDRVEIYRALVVDPMAARRHRAKLRSKSGPPQKLR